MQRCIKVNFLYLIVVLTKFRCKNQQNYMHIFSNRLVFIAMSKLFSYLNEKSHIELNIIGKPFNNIESIFIVVFK